MKNYKIMMLGALAVGFSACDEAPADAPMQVNPQWPVMEANAVQLTPDALLTSGETINLDSYVDASSMPMFTVAANTLPEGCKLNAEMQIAADESFEEFQSVALDYDGNQFTTDPALMHEAYLELFGDATTAQTAYYRVPVYFTTESGTDYRLGADNYYVASGSFKETPMVSIMPDDYWYTPGGANNWNAANSSYLYFCENPDNPVYYGAILVDNEFKIANTTDWTGIDYGDGGNGTLAQGGGNFSGYEKGVYFFIANLTELTYSIAKIEKVGIMGNGNGWGDDQFLTADETGLVYSGEVKLDGEWKVRFNQDWALNYGGRKVMPTLDGANFNSPAGTYVVTVDFNGHHPKIKAKLK